MAYFLSNLTMKVLYEDDHLPGDIKGRTVAEIAADSPETLVKFQEESRSFCISDEVMDNLDKYYRTFNSKARTIRATGHGAVS